jgi:tetratricopeptide (TPR) repeat protein
MQRLIALAGALLIAGAAQAQTAIICAQAQSQWDRAAASGAGATMLRVAARIPASCAAVRRQADARITAVQQQYAQQQLLRRQAEQRAQRQAAASAHAGEGDDADAQAAPPFELAAATPPAEPADPCSVRGVQAKYPQVPVFRPDLSSLSARARADLADRYVQRGEAFAECHDDAQARGDYRDAQALDPKSYDAFEAQGDLDLDGQDYQGALEAYGAAINVKDHASPDENVLTAYAGRAEAEAALQRWADEIRDLQFVTQNYRNYNAAQQNDLAPPSAYHERLGKALYLTHDDEAAAAEFKVVGAQDLDWQDLRFLAGRSLLARDWTGAIDQLKQALGLMPDGDAARPQKAEIEVMMAQAYLASGDTTGALDHFKIAEAYDPANTDAHAGHQRIGDPPPPPTFQPPSLQPVVMPQGVADLGHDDPPPFCDQKAKNAYLDTVAAANDAVNANITEIGRVSDTLLKARAVYDADPRLAYKEKIDDLRLFDDELTRLRLQSRTLQDTGNALGAFWHRIADDRGDLIACRAPSSAAGG